MSAPQPDAHLLAHARDLLERAEKGELTYTAFLTPLQQKQLLRALPLTAQGYRLCGGYADAERQRLLFLPPYLQELDEQTQALCLADTLAECILPLGITGSGFRTLSHRDFLGAVLHLGVQRAALGDLCALTAHSAVLFCDSVMAAFLQQNLTRVANDAVGVSPCVLPPDFNGGRSYRPITETVASARADAVVAALANLSRERAQALFREGLIELDYEPLDKPDHPITAGCVLVVRGKGKFIVRAISDKTKKGRYRLLADQYL